MSSINVPSGRKIELINDIDSEIYSAPIRVTLACVDSTKYNMAVLTVP
jgi:hypothetical protein